MRWHTFSPDTHRMRVPGGWLVRTISGFGNTGSVAITFYPDPTHSWEVHDR